MKFDCGLPKERSRRAKLEWHPWFAWYPVRVGDHDCRWLETVERRFTWIGPVHGALYDPKYRAVEEQSS